MRSWLVFGVVAILLQIAAGTVPGVQKIDYDIFRRDSARGLPYEIREMMLPMRDGIRLYTRIHLPKGHSGRTGAVFARSPYSRPDGAFGDPNPEYLRRGLVDIRQDCRGTGRSEGEAAPQGAVEGTDGEDTIEALSKEDWSNGRFATDGASYGGSVQWILSLRGNPHHVAMAPFFSGASNFDSAFIGGALFYQIKMHWSFTQWYKRNVSFDGVPDWDGIPATRSWPLKDIDRKSVGHVVPNWQAMFLRGPVYNEHDYGHADVIRHPDRVTAPAYIRAGWYDFYAQPTIDGFTALRARGGTREVREFTRIVIGPWTHMGNRNPGLIRDGGVFAETYSNATRFVTGLLGNPKRDPLPDEPPVRYFTMGDNRWRTAACWPPEGSEKRVFYLHSDGALDRSAPRGAESPDAYDYNPDDPVLSRGGTFLGPPACGDGMVSQNEVEERNDVLTFTTAPLDRDVVFAGAPVVRLWAASSAPDTDFTAKVCDVHPDGTSYNIAEGIVRARYRNGKGSEFLVPGLPTLFEIRLWSSANAFLRGHRIRVDISSSNFPHFDRNPNTRAEFGTEERPVVARQTVYHDTEHPSCLWLPVLESDKNIREGSGATLAFVRTFRLK